MQTARQLAFRYGPRYLAKAGRYLYRKYRSRRRSKKSRSVRLFYQAQNITANINFNYGFNLVSGPSAVDPGTVTNAFQMLSALDIANSLVLSEAHRAYSRLYDEYKIASVALYYLPYTLADPLNSYKNHDVLQGNVFGVIDNTFKDEGVNDLQWSFLQVLQNPKTKFVLWSTGGGLQQPLALYANPETAEQKDDWTQTLDANGNYLQPNHFTPIAYVGAQVMPKEPVQDVNAWPAGTAAALIYGGFRMAFKVYYRNPRLADANAHKSLPKEICQEFIQPASTEIFKQQENVLESNGKQ